jgi:hypothetical protein
MANWTGNLYHIDAMRSANPDSGADHKCDSMDSDIVTYVNRYEMNHKNKVKTIMRKRKAIHTPSTLPITIPSFHTSPWGRPKFKVDVEVGVLSVPLPSVHVEKGKAQRLIWDRDGDDHGSDTVVCGRTPEGCPEA